MLTAIVNHACNGNAIALRRGFAAWSPVVSIDSGSNLTTEERPWFDDCLPNVYYSGLVNRAFEHAATLADHDILLLLCSDVEVADPAHLLRRLTEAFRDPAVQLWGPCSSGSPHPHMWPKGSGGTRQVSFIEGFCFAARKSLLARVCPVDLEVNRLGWGIDVLLGYHAARQGGKSLVDDATEVRHPITTGYGVQEARAQRNTWFGSISPRARRFRQLATLPGVRAGWGCQLLYRWAARGDHD